MFHGVSFVIHSRTLMIKLLLASVATTYLNRTSSLGEMKTNGIVLLTKPLFFAVQFSDF